MDRENRTEARDNTATDNPTPQGPADKIPDGRLKATIWRNEGENGPFYATEFTRTYTDADGNIRDGHSFGRDDLLKLSELARKAYDRTAELRREEFRERRQAAADKTKQVNRQR